MKTSRACIGIAKLFAPYRPTCEHRNLSRLISLFLPLLLPLFLSLFFPRCISPLERPAMFLEIYTGLYTGRVSPGENAHSVLAKLAYRFINYGMKFPPPFLPARFPLLPLCICGTASWASACVRFVLDSQRDSPLRGRRAVCALLLLVSSCEHKSLFAPRDGFFLLQCALTVRVRVAVGCYRARVPSRVIMLDERGKSCRKHILLSLRAFVADGKKNRVRGDGEGGGT